MLDTDAMADFLSTGKVSFLLISREQQHNTWHLRFGHGTNCLEYFVMSSRINNKTIGSWIYVGKNHGQIMLFGAS